MFGALKLAEPLPKGSSDIYQSVQFRNDKSVGTYHAINTSTEFEHGITHRLTGSIAIKGQQLTTSGIQVDGYIPGDRDTGLEFAGLEGELLYNFLSPAKDPIGVSAFWSLEHLVLDPHSGRSKKTTSVEMGVILQKYYLDGQLVWAANASIESTLAKRDPINGLPQDFEWPTFTEVEIETKLSTGVSYRFIPNWYAGIEALWEEEHETEVGSERQSLFVGPSIHYGGKRAWATLTYLVQVHGSGESFDGQDVGYHLIEKTKNEVLVRIGYNF